MTTLQSGGVYLRQNRLIPPERGLPAPEEARTGTMTYGVLAAHNTSGRMDALQLRFDAMASHDITYVGIIQTARASGLTAFPLPYVLTNCHNSLCAVGGTINEDDHRFGLSAAHRYGGEYVPAHMAVIHQYMRECYTGGGRMILASDSHTRYGPYGTLAIGEGGPELVKQLLGRTYDIARPEVVAVWLEGTPQPGVGPQDVALVLIGATFPKGFVKNKILEFIGPGIAGLPMDFRNGIDVMTTETTCLSTLWQTDARVAEELARFGRAEAHRALQPGALAYYDAAVHIDLGAVEPMIALPFHPSRTYPIRVFRAHASELLRETAANAAEQWDLAAPPPLTDKVCADGQVRVDQGVIVGCSGGLYQNIAAARAILSGGGMDDSAFALSVYPASQPMALALARDGILADLTAMGATVRTAFCGPCFGAGDVPAHGGLSIRHATRNFPNREGSKPGEGQSAFVALMDARSIAATARNGGLLTAATELSDPPSVSDGDAYVFDGAPYARRVYRGVGRSEPKTPLVYGPNIADWPPLPPLPDALILTVAAALYDPVTTTDELIPSGETSSYRSNPYRLAEFTLSRKAPGYVALAKEILGREKRRREDAPEAPGLGSAVAALRPGDGSAREQAASCQRVLGGVANIALEYATKRYRSNLINWGMLPLLWPDLDTRRLAVGDTIALPHIRAALLGDTERVEALWTHGGVSETVTLALGPLTRQERDVILAGCLINYYAHER
ncbi:MAG: hydratase [Oscillospiraceae bacterium]|jgi:aconitate hydratase|nr:hydratase [Oscillospiraceae bacterium]